MVDAINKNMADLIGGLVDSNKKLIEVQSRPRKLVQNADGSKSAVLQ